MPTLPLPPGGADIDGGDLPVSSEEDVLAEFPRPIRDPETAPVRDAFAGAWTEGFFKYQDVAAFAAAQSDPLRATGLYLLEFAEEHGVVPARGESEDSIRARIFEAPEIVTPQALIDGVNKIISAVTDKSCRLLELGLDGLFIHAGEVDAVWQSYIGAAPDYPDRYYEEDQAYEPNAAIPGDGKPRRFHLVIPRFNTTEDDFPYLFSSAPLTGPFALSTNLSGAMFVFSEPTEDQPRSTTAILQAIVGFVGRAKGQGIAWSLFVDETL